MILGGLRDFLHAMSISENSRAKDQGLAITSQAEADGHEDCVSQLHSAIAWFEIRSQALALVIGKRMK
jgi:hypothetical protein